MIIQEIPVEIYDFNIIFVYDDNDKTKIPHSILRKYNINNKRYLRSLYSCLNKKKGFFTLQIDSVIFIIIKNEDSVNHLLKCIAHEALHATIFIMNSVDVSLNSNSEEAFCYLHDYIVGKITLCIEDILRLDLQIEKENKEKEVLKSIL